jgi:lysophospholipase L1-like esterase
MPPPDTVPAAPPGVQTLLARDGLHPSGKMYARWAKAALPFAAAALAEAGPADQHSKTD